MLIPSSLNGNSRLSNEAPEPKALCSYQAASPTLTTNHPSEAGFRPDSACSSLASSGMRRQAIAPRPGTPYLAVSATRALPPRALAEDQVDPRAALAGCPRPRLLGYHPA